MENRSYILQTKKRGYCACYVISLLNVRIYYGDSYLISLEDNRWEEMVDKYRCRYGSCLDRKLVRKDLNIGRRKIDRDEIPNNLPAEITSFTKVGLHSSLVIDVDKDNWTIVNYDGYKGKLITVVNKKNIDFLKRGHSNDEHYFLYIKNRGKK